MGSYNILLALSYDEAYPLTAMSAALANDNYHVTVSRGTDTFEFSHQKTFDVVVTDQLGVVEKVKARSPETLAILILATRSRSIPTAQVIQSSADDYLFRPFELNELQMRVTHGMDQLKLRRRNTPPERCECGLHEKILNMVETMSHDVRGSLLSISATLKLLSRGHYGEMDKGAAHRVKELFFRTSGLIGMTEEYLGRSFSANEDLESKEETLNLVRDILIPVLKELSSGLKGHRLLIDHRLLAMSNKPTPLRASRIWLKMVFRNLLKNAIQYGDKKGKIAIGFEDQHSSYRFNVYNSGNPVPAECRQRLFTTFTGNGDQSIEPEKMVGTGLGLYLIKKVLWNLRGDIWYEAKEDGSNFIFTIPARSTLPAEPSLSPEAS